ncbi:MAG: glutathione S-transferase N-terminal domain-containing protein [Saccharospirillum sp.]|uniref:glutathione S-transferase N-terminal domain-containing protein n=1 Tax=Saccharospirillum sp. TaxID=2033801 RepID=UPI00329749ED
MIKLYYWTTPNGHKITLCLEEMGLSYEVIPVNIGKGDQFQPEFLRFSPNNKIPAIIDTEPGDGGEPVPVFESGAILTYLAEKTGRFYGESPRQRLEVTQWLFWQMGGLGPMAGQNHHFNVYAPEPVPYAIDRYVKETARLYAVMDRQLADQPFLAGNYSIADMASYPWVVSHERQKQDLNDFPNVKRWHAAISERLATKRAYAVVDQIREAKQGFTDDEKNILFGQDASRVSRN